MTPATHRLQLGVRVRTSVHRDQGPCSGLFAGYQRRGNLLGTRLRAGACRGGAQSDALQISSDEYDLELQLSRGRELGSLAVELGVGAGATWLRQTFAGPGIAPSRNTLGGQASGGLSLSWRSSAGFGLLLDVAAQCYLFSLADPQEGERLRARLALRAAAGVFLQF